VSRNDKMKFIRLIKGSNLSISEALAKFDVPRSTYYRWKRKLKSQGIKGLVDNKPYRARTWNQLLSSQVDKILEYATFNPERSAFISPIESILAYLKQPFTGGYWQCYTG